jgi:hypothetical protein
MIKKNKTFNDKILSHPWISIHRIEYNNAEFVMYLHYDHDSKRISLSRSPEVKADEYCWKNSDPKTLSMFIVVSSRALAIAKRLDLIDQAGHDQKL